MKGYRLLPFYAAVSLISGCAGIANEVVPTGNGSFMVANHGTMGWSSAGAQRAKAYEIANLFCGKQSKVVQAINERETDSGFGKIASAEIEFRCVKPDTP